MSAPEGLTLRPGPSRLQAPKHRQGCLGKVLASCTARDGQLGVLLKARSLLPSPVLLPGLTRGGDPAVLGTWPGEQPSSDPSGVWEGLTVVTLPELLGVEDLSPGAPAAAHTSLGTCQAGPLVLVPAWLLCSKGAPPASWCHQGSPCRWGYVLTLNIMDTQEATSK